MDTNTGSTKTTAHAPIAAQPSVRSGALAKWAKLWADIKHNKVSYFLLAPFLLLFTFFTIIPIITSVALSFSYYNIVESPRFVGLSNYRLLFVDDDIFLQAVGITLKFAFITGPVGTFLLFFLAWLISQIPQKYRFFLHALLLYAFDNERGCDVGRLAIFLCRGSKRPVKSLFNRIRHIK